MSSMPLIPHKRVRRARGFSSETSASMESFPVEVIGNILSRLGAARDVMMASVTCRSWLEARKHHLHTLSFNCGDWLGYSKLNNEELETLITKTLFQTRGLECLSITNTNSVHKFSKAVVIAWLMYARDSLRQLSLEIQNSEPKIIDIVESCCGLKLEVLSLAGSAITGTSYKFPCLKSLYLNYASFYPRSLSLLITACPKLEFLSITTPEFQDTVVPKLNLRCPSLKMINVVGMDFPATFKLEARRLEHLHLKSCRFECFQLIDNDILKNIRIEYGSVGHLNLWESTNNLEVVQIHFTRMWPKFYHKLLRSSLKLRRLTLWNVEFDKDDGVMDLDTISVSFPKLSHLSLCLGHEVLPCRPKDAASHLIENVVYLEIGWPKIIDCSPHLVAALVARCPNLKKLVIHELLSGALSERQVLAGLTTSIFKLMKDYAHVDVQFLYW